MWKWKKEAKRLTALFAYLSEHGHEALQPDPLVSRIEAIRQEIARNHKILES
jgi:hypothetical protein